MSGEAATLSPNESELLDALRTHPKGTDQSTLLGLLEGWSDSDVAETLNALSAKHYVDFMQAPGNRLIFRARDMEEINKTGNMTDSERIVYQFIKGCGNKGTWIKDIKVKSGLHVQVVTQMIKNLEKKALIKAIKSVKNPTKKVYMLAELEPSVELTGGTWYTDQELDVEFIDQLSNQLYKYIFSKSFPADPEAIFPASHPYPTCGDIQRWIGRSGITSVELSHADVQALLDRLVFDGKIERVQNTHTGRSFGSSGRPRRIVGGQSLGGSSDDEWGASEEVVGDFEDDAWSYRAMRSARGEGAAWTDAPCGRCPVFSFCRETGPVNPSGCVYLKRWLES